jgi:pimeloyl-ACP methyl ester carboxylesterase
MNIIKNIIVKGKHNKPIVTDVFYKESSIKKPILIFCHGYKGFKDWGSWNLMAETFAKAGFCFIKFNFSHNGGTVEQPIDFPDLEAFGNNNLTKELDDLDAVISWTIETFHSNKEFDTSNISLLGHSRGGGIVAIKAEEDSRINNLITLASVSDYKSRFPQEEHLKQWKKDGVMFVRNGRTKQDMPHYFQFFEDFVKNEKRLTIKRAISNLKIPHLIIHGSNDPTVLIEEAKTIHKWNPKSVLKIIEAANHVFETSHPWNKSELSKEMNQVCSLIIKFSKK